MIRGMNKLPLAKRVQILSMLCEGSSMRSISRVVDVSLNTVSKLLIDAGLVCAAFHDKTVRNVPAKRIQADEIWAFCYAKQKNVPEEKEGEAGDVWTWTALDAETKLMVSWWVGPRDKRAATQFLHDLAGRLSTRIQLTTDGHNAYLHAVERIFGMDVDFAQLIKTYAPVPEGERRYSPPVCVGAEPKRIMGNPDWDHVSTSYVERSNLTMRMSMRRFTRLTNAFSKKFENHCHALALYFVWYNFCRIHKTLRVTPAMAAGVTDKLMSMEDIAQMVEDAAPKPGPRGPYKKRNL